MVRIKQLILFFASVITASALLVSCAGETDPFLTDTVTELETLDENGKTAPDPGFFGLTVKESYEKYGIPSKNRIQEKVFDGTYIYEAGAQTVSRREFPDGEEWIPVCTDPVCVHTEDSGCPLAQCRSAFVCFGGRLVFVNVLRDAIFIYDPRTNKSTLIKDGLIEPAFLLQGDDLYCRYKTEDKDFDSSYVFLSIGEDGSYRQLGQIAFEDYRAGNNNALPVIYEDRYAVYGAWEKTDGGYSAVLYSHDLQSGELKTVYTEDHPELKKATDPVVEEGNVNSLMVYGKSVLFRIAYSVGWEAEFVKGDAYVLADLDGGGAKTLVRKDNAEGSLIYSSKCVVYREEGDGYAITVLFPETGEKTGYDLAADAASSGIALPEDCSLYIVCKGAVSFNTHYQCPVTLEGGIVTSMDVPWQVIEYDLKSGAVFRYAKPGEDEMKTALGFR